MLADSSKEVTVVLTSCNRFDLLDRTLDSFFLHNDYPIHRFILIEDSGLESVRAITSRYKQVNIEVIVNNPGIGQWASIDKVYSMVSTEYIFHCEDDWLFLRPGILRESLALMEADSSIALVWARGDQGAPAWVKRKPVETCAGVRIRPIDPKAHHLWGNFTFNPGLRRLSHYKLMKGGYSSHGEGGTSLFLKRAGYRMVILAETGVGHIGGEGRTTGGPAASLAITSRPKRKTWKTRVKRIPRSVKLRVSHMAWKATLWLRFVRDRVRGT